MCYTRAVCCELIVAAHQWHSGCPKPNGFTAFLKEAAGGTRPLTQSCATLLACFEELRNRIKQRHGCECVKVVQAFESAHKTSRPAEELLACVPSAPHAMMQLRNATLRAAAANRVALETGKEKNAAEKEVQEISELGGAEASKLYSLNTDCMEGGQVHCGGSSRYQAAQRVVG